MLVDVHAEATSEKVALARWLDGRVTAVIGTHTHVQTSDARVQPGGTAAITDAGMTGPHDSVIGVKAELATHRMRTGMPVRFEVATGGVRIEGALVECDADERPGHRDQAGSGSLALSVAADDEDGEQRHEHEVADEHEPRGRRVELLHEIPVGRAGTRAASARRRRRGARSRRCRGGPGRARRSPSSQIRNWGETTLPKATNATTAAAA